MTIGVLQHSVLGKVISWASSSASASPTTCQIAGDKRRDGVEMGWASPVSSRVFNREEAARLAFLRRHLRELALDWLQQGGHYGQLRGAAALPWRAATPRSKKIEARQGGEVDAGHNEKRRVVLREGRGELRGRPEDISRYQRQVPTRIHNHLAADSVDGSPGTRVGGRVRCPLPRRTWLQIAGGGGGGLGAAGAEQKAARWAAGTSAGS
ncbi:hypothetical protein Emag_007430 [Eimeria magna]